MVSSSLSSVAKWCILFSATVMMVSLLPSLVSATQTDELKMKKKKNLKRILTEPTNTGVIPEYSTLVKIIPDYAKGGDEPATDTNVEGMRVMKSSKGKKSKSTKTHKNEKPVPPTCFELPVLKEGIQTYTCDAGDAATNPISAIGYVVSIPAECVDSAASCGVIMDVHGANMNGASQNSNNNMQQLGNDAGYIVIQPWAPIGQLPLELGGSKGGWWFPLLHHDQLLLFFRYAVHAFRADRRRVHITGYSLGGFATWNILCKAPDLICSAAPLEASALDTFWGEGYGTGACFSPPDQQQQANSSSLSQVDIHRSIIFTNGIINPLSWIHNARQQVENVKQAWGLTPAMQSTHSGNSYTMQSWQQPSRNFTYVEHSNVVYLTPDGRSMYNTTGATVDILGGHCVPNDATNLGTDQCSDPETFCCLAEFTWGELVLEFFQNNPCRE